VRWSRHVSDSGPSDQGGVPSPHQHILPGISAVFAPSPALQLQISSHQGPLPPAQELAALEAAHPGAAAWVLEEAKTAAAHVRAMEARVLRYQARDALLRRALPFCLVAMLLAISALMAVFANAYVGGAAFVTTLAGVVTVYLKGAMDGEEKPGREVADPKVPPRGS
jgi:uncharacterized membrane protein